MKVYFGEFPLHGACLWFKDPVPLHIPPVPQDGALPASSTSLPRSLAQSPILGGGSVHIC